MADTQREGNIQLNSLKKQLENNDVGDLHERHKEIPDVRISLEQW
jgi:hypothetical protein